jgi:hypothetical protein
VGTQRDLVEAQSFNRRRLVTAFVSGAPGGREVEPARPGRTFVAGLALAALLTAGAAVSGVLSDRTASDGDDPGRSPPATRPSPQPSPSPHAARGEIWLRS